MDDKNCAKNVQAAGGGELTELGKRFSAMAGDADREWNVVRFFGSFASANSQFGWAMIGPPQAYRTGAYGKCDGGTATGSMAAIVAHELLGHVWQARGGGSDQDEVFAVQSQNLYHAMPGKGPTRCEW